MKNNFSTTKSTPLEPTQEEIATAAYHLYVEDGRRDGNDLHHWLRAESLLKAAALEARGAPETQIQNAEESARPAEARVVKNGSRSPRRRQSEPTFA